MRTSGKCRLSIVIPVYNTEEYLAGCILSCMDQDIPIEEYELVIINDGSVDGSAGIIEEYRKMYPNIRVHLQSNSGLSVARNAGLGMAEGTYVWFVDSDDRIMKHSLKHILSEVSGADILAFGCGSLQERMTGEEFIISTKCRFQHGAPYYVFRRKFLLDERLMFYPGIYHEDSEFTPRALCLAGLVTAIPEDCYCRIYRDGSITRTASIKRAYDLIFVISRLRSFIVTEVQSAKLQKQMLRLLPLLANSSLKVASESDPHLWNDYMIKFREESLIDCYFQSRDLKYVLEGCLLKLSGNPMKAYRLLKKLI